MRKSIGYECQVEGSCTKDVGEFIAHAQRTLARERAERKARPELAKAEADYQNKNHPDRPFWRTLQKLRRKLLEALESITQPGDEQRAKEMCDQKLQGWRRSAEEHVRAVLDAGRAPILAKAQVVGHPWYGKTIRFLGQPQVTEMVRDDGLVTVVGTWVYTVEP